MTSLFEPRNPLAIGKRRLKKNTPTCLNCPANRQKQDNFLDMRISSKAEVLVILPSKKFNSLKKKIRTIIQDTTVVSGITFLPDILCKHNMDTNDKAAKEAYAKRNVHCHFLLSEMMQRSKNIKHIILVGIGATRAYMGEYYSKDFQYSKIRGCSFPDLKRNLYVSVLHELSTDALMGSKRDMHRLENTVFTQDLKNGISYMGKAIDSKWRTPLDYCKEYEEEEAIEAMKDILDGKFDKYVAWDYEATGLKPYRKGQKLVTCSLSPRDDYSFAFYLTEKTTKWLTYIIANITIPKVAANNSYEYKMTKYLFGTCVNNLIYDCCLGRHVIDLRRGITSVKFQARLLFGIHDYEKAMRKYLEPCAKEESEYGSNSINTIMTAPKELTLKYNAMDSLLERWIANHDLPLIHGEGYE